MRLLYIFAFLSLHGFLFGQLYIHGESSDSIDRIQVTAQDNFRNSLLTNSKLGFDSLLQYWSKEISNKQSPISSQNYYYSLIKSYEINYRLGILKDSDFEYILSLEDDIIKNVSKSNNVLGMYYSLLSLMQSKLKGKVKESISYSENSIDIFKSNQDDNFEILSKEYTKLAHLNKNINNYEESERLHLISLDYASRVKENNEAAIIFSKYGLSTIYHLQNDYEAALKELNEILEQSKQVFDIDHDIMIKSYDLISIVYDDMGDIGKALEYSLLSLKSMRIRQDEHQTMMAKSYSLISARHRRLGNIKLAKTYLDSTLILLEDSENYARLASAYNTKSLLSKDIKEEINSLKTSLKYCRKDSWCSKMNIPIIIANLGRVYAKSGDMQTALNYLLEAKNIKENDEERLGKYLANDYASIADVLNYLDSLDLAIEYHQKAVDHSTKIRGENNYYTGIMLSSLGRSLIQKKQFKLSNKYLTRSRRIIVDNLGETSLSSTQNLKYFSVLHEAQGKYKQALDYSLRAYNIADKKAIDSEGFTNPYIFDVISLYQKLNKIDSSQYYLQKVLNQTGYEDFNTEDFNLFDIPDYNYWATFDRLFQYLKVESKIHDEQQKYLINKITTLIELSDKLRTQYFYETSEKITQDGIRAFYNWAINKLAFKYQNSFDNRYLELIFECIEKSKSLLIDRQYIRNDAIIVKDVPSKVILREKNLVYQYENAYNKFMNESSDSIKNILEDKMFAIQESKEEFVDSLERIYPEYYVSRYKQNIISLKECKSLALSENRSFAIFHWGDSILHKLLISQDTLLYDSNTLDEIENDLNPLTSILNSQRNSNTEDDFVHEKSNFIMHSYNLFDLLLNKDDIDLSIDLTIIPDGKLNQLPFDVLLSSQPESDNSYRHLPYLLKDHVINYVGSVSNYNYILNSQQKKSSSSYKGFAPSYGDKLISDVSMSRGEYNLQPLLYNTKEVESASYLFNGKKFLYKDATEHAFKQNASDNKILHLAMHTRISDRFPLETHLIFDKDSSATEDGKLYLDELAKMNLNNHLVVLSACETNVGEQIAGEGILGIARAFQIALCPNIILTNWLVDDKSSSKIMDEFFMRLKAKYSAAAALRHSKLTFIENSSMVHSHPKYWAAFSFYGNANTSIQQNSIRDYVVFIVAFVSLIIFVFLKHKRRFN